MASSGVILWTLHVKFAIKGVSLDVGYALHESSHFLVLGLGFACLAWLGLAWLGAHNRERRVG